MKSAREAIGEAYRAFEDAFAKGDAEALASIYADDAEWFMPQAPVVRGRAAITSAWRSALGSGGTGAKVHVETGEVEEAGEWAYEVGGFTTTGADGSTLNSGKYLVIWRKQASGQWKTYRDMFHWDVPPGQEPPR